MKSPLRRWQKIAALKLLGRFREPKKPPICDVGMPFSLMRTHLKLSRAVLVRRAVDPRLLLDLFKIAEEKYRPHDIDPSIRWKYFAQGHISSAELGADKLESLANDGYLSEFMRGALGLELPLNCPRNIMVTRILPPNLTQERSDVPNKIAFHQDEYFTLASAPAAVRPPLYFTIWLPLCDCGQDAPGLSVVLGSDEPVVMGEPDQGWEYYIKKKYGNRSLWSPAMRRGDVLVFTSRTIHESYVTPNMTKTRYSLEMRGGINW